MGADDTVEVAEVVVLGSGSPVPDPERGGAALAVFANDGWMMVDCGRAATQRAVAAGLDLRTVVAVAITHHHSDDVSDLATFATARWTAGAASPLVVNAPNGPATQFARHCLDAFEDQSFYGQAEAAAGPRPVIEVHPFAASHHVSVVHTAATWSLSSVLVDHHPVEPCVGYLIQHRRRRVAVSGDTAVCDGMRVLARDVDVLVHETLLSDRVSPALLEWNAAARAVGELAAQVVPRILVAHPPDPGADLRCGREPRTSTTRRRPASKGEPSSPTTCFGSRSTRANSAHARRPTTAHERARLSTFGAVQRPRGAPRPSHSASITPCSTRVAYQPRCRPRGAHAGSRRAHRGDHLTCVLG